MDPSAAKKKEELLFPLELLRLKTVSVPLIHPAVPCVEDNIIAGNKCTTRIAYIMPCNGDRCILILQQCGVISTEVEIAYVQLFPIIDDYAFCRCVNFEGALIDSQRYIALSSIVVLIIFGCENYGIFRCVAVCNDGSDCTVSPAKGVGNASLVISAELGKAAPVHSV